MANVRFFFYVGSNTWTTVNTTGLNLLDNKFHHLVGQKTASTLEIYVDGTQRASIAASGTISYTLGPDLNIGRHANGDPSRYFNGTIDEVKVYTRALTAMEIATRTSLGLNESAGAVTFIDSSANGNHGFCSTSTCPQSGVTGVVGTAALFDGAADYIAVPGNASLKPASTVAVSAFVKTATAPPDGGEIVSMGDSYSMRMLADGNVRFFFYVGNNTWTPVNTTGLNLLDNAFHHLVGQKTASTLEIYVDGTQRASIPASGTISYTLGPDLNIGRHGNGFPTRFFNGTIDEVSVYSRALSTAEIGALASAGGAPLRIDSGTPGVIGLGPLTLADGTTSNYIPAKGMTATESSFPGVMLLRLTDGSDGTACEHAYSYWHVLNANNTKILFSCDNQLYLQNFDPSTKTMVGAKYNLYTVMTAPLDSYTDIMWSSVLPNIMYVHQGTRLYSANLDTGQYFLEVDFSQAADPNGNRMSSSEFLVQGSKSDYTGSSNTLSDDVFAFLRSTTTDPTGSIGYVIWSRSQQRVLTTAMYTATPLDEVKINKTGEYLLLFNLRADRSSPQPGDLQNTIVRVADGASALIYKNGTDKPAGHYDLGKTIQVGEDPSYDPAINARLFTTPHSPYDVHSWNGDWFHGWSGGHYSMLADNENWALASLYGSINGCDNPTIIYPLQSEIFQLSTNSSGTRQYRRIAHHRSQFLNGCNGDDGYYSQPHAAISRDGRFVTWTANMYYSNTNSYHRDVFMAIISAAP